MEPVFMVLGQSAAIAASMAVDNNEPLHQLKYGKLKRQLLDYHQRLK